MRTQFYNKRNVFKAKYHHNTVMHLIIACAVAYVLLQGLSVILIVLSSTPKTVFHDLILPNIALQPFSAFIHKPWVLFSYFWMHTSFLNMLSNMLWLYCFGSVIQSFVGYQEVFPMFFISSVVSGLGFIAVSSFWSSMPDSLILTSLPGVTAFAVAAFALVPGYRFFLTEHFSVPIWLVLVIFLMLNILTVGDQYPMLVLLGFSVLCGAGYIGLLKSGFKPGAFLYRSGNKIQSYVTPAEELAGVKSAKRNQTLKISKHQIVEHPSQEYIDSLLDKISQKGYKSLTDEEKETLLNASKSK